MFLDVGDSDAVESEGMEGRRSGKNHGQAEEFLEGDHGSPFEW
jgi:hypothetical protein